MVVVLTANAHENYGIVSKLLQNSRLSIVYRAPFAANTNGTRIEVMGSASMDVPALVQSAVDAINTQYPGCATCFKL